MVGGKHNITILKVQSLRKAESHCSKGLEVSVTLPPFFSITLRLVVNILACTFTYI